MQYTQALIVEGAARDGIARMLAVRHQLPVVDLPTVGVTIEASQQIPLQTFRRHPVRARGGVLRVAVARRPVRVG